MAMTNEEAAVMHLAQAKLYFEKAGLQEQAAAVMALINKLQKTPQKASA